MEKRQQRGGRKFSKWNKKNNIIKDIHIVKSLKTNCTSQNLSISMSLPTLLTDWRKKCTKAQQWLKKHRGFGDKLEVFSFDWKPPNQNFDNEKRKIFIKIFGLAK